MKNRKTNIYRNIFLSILFLGVLLSARCLSDTTNLEELIEQIDREEVFLDPQWIALLYYQNSTNGGLESQADSQNFFFSSQGKTNSLSEMSKFLTALLQPESQAHCQFPARSKWLTFRLNIQTLDFSSCVAYQAWLSKQSSENVSIYFSSFSTYSPASLMGHTFLSIKSKHNDSPLLDNTVNFTADASSSVNTFDYVIKGINGGFPTVVEEEETFRLLRRYNTDEARDIWEFDLALSAEEISILLDHIWEIREGVFKYHYLSENCSYRILGLLNAVKPQLLNMEKFNELTIPMNSLRELDRLNLLKLVHYFPSSEKRFQLLTEGFTASDKKIVREIIQPKIQIDQFDFEKYSKQKFLYLYAAHQLLSIEIESGKVRSKPGQEKLHEILLEISKTKKIHIPTLEFSTSNPLESHKPSKIGVAGGYNEQGFLQLDYSLATNGWSDPYVDILQDVKAEYLKLSLRVDEHSHAKLQTFTVFDLLSTYDFSRFFRRYSWGAHLTYNRELNKDNKRGMVGDFVLKYGITQSTHRHRFSFLTTAGLHHDFGSGFDLSYGYNFILHSKFERLNYLIEHEQKKVRSDLNPTKTKTSASVFYDKHRNSRLFMEYRYERFDKNSAGTFLIGITQYF